MKMAGSVLGVGLVGKVDEEHPGFAGNSILASPRGDILAALEFEEGILVGEVDLGAVEAARRLRLPSGTAGRRCTAS